MQRVLLILTVIFVVAASLGVGALAAHWPFWHRAWQWHQAPDGWPEKLAGPVRTLQAAANPGPLVLEPDAELQAAGADAATRVLARVTPDAAGAWFAPSHDRETMVDGRGLSAALLAPLFAILEGRHPGLLDAPVGRYLEEWSQDQRGAITPRQFLWQLSGLPAGEFNPLNPFSARSQLASGPDYVRAALRWRLVWPPGSHFEESPVNAQLLALVAARAEQAGFAELVEQLLWSRAAGSPATMLLDHRRGNAAAHCCFSASVADWLRLATLLANDGAHAGVQLWEPGFLAQMATASPVHEGHGLGFALRTRQDGMTLLVLEHPGRSLIIAPGSRSALLWIGSGKPPAGLASLLPAASPPMR